MGLDRTQDLIDLKNRIRKEVDTKLIPAEQDIEETGVIPVELLNQIRSLGLFGSHTPQNYGGLGLTMEENCMVIEEMARTHIAFFYTYSMNVHIGSKAIELHGTEEQKQKWLPRLASGNAIGCYALTEEAAGSDAAAVEMHAASNDKDFVLNGTKRYITNAAIADLFTIFARTGTSSTGRPLLSAFMIEKDTPGLRTGQVFQMAGGRGAFHSELILENCRVPAANMIGNEGQGFQIAMQCLDAGRINWAAYCVGAAQHLVDLTISHLQSRQQFGRPLSANQGLQWMLADIVADLNAARMVTLDAARQYESAPEKRSLIGARAKLTASETASRIADTAVQLFGGEGYRKDLPIERIWREVRGIRILEGTSEIMRHIIARDTLRGIA